MVDLVLEGVDPVGANGRTTRHGDVFGLEFNKSAGGETKSIMLIRLISINLFEDVSSGIGGGLFSNSSSCALSFTPEFFKELHA